MSDITHFFRNFFFKFYIPPKLPDMQYNFRKTKNKNKNFTFNPLFLQPFMFSLLGQRDTFDLLHKPKGHLVLNL